MGMDWPAGAHVSSGGTELMGRRIEARLPPDLADRFQITLSQPGPRDPDKIQILWSHACVGEPHLDHLADGGWRRYERLVFVSDWQAREFVTDFGIPEARCRVIPNAITPLPGPAITRPPADRPVRLIYTSNPSRGLLLLYQAFQSICEVRDDVELDVYSSFKLYGWDDADRAYAPLYDLLRAHPRINYHGSVPNDAVRVALRRADVFAYPSTFRETSCLALIEAMSAGLACVHPDLGALPETAAGHTFMYPYRDDQVQHAISLRDHLLTVIAAVRAGHPGLAPILERQKAYADDHFDVDRRVRQWVDLLRSLVPSTSTHH